MLEPKNLNATHSKELLKIEQLKDSRSSRLTKLLCTDKMIERRTIKRLPQSSILNDVRNFIPKLRTANDELKEAISSGVDVNIENVDHSESVIEMDLGLFLCDDEQSDSSSSSENGSDGDNSSEETEEDSPTEKSSGTNKKPLITELNNK